MLETKNFPILLGIGLLSLLLFHVPAKFVLTLSACLILAGLLFNEPSTRTPCGQQFCDSTVARRQKKS